MSNNIGQTAHLFKQENLLARSGMDIRDIQAPQTLAENGVRPRRRVRLSRIFKVSGLEMTYDEASELNNERTAFFETLSHQFIAVTGCGVYVYLSPVDINGLFNQFMNGNMPIQIFVQKCVKNVLR